MTTPPPVRCNSQGVEIEGIGAKKGHHSYKVKGRKENGQGGCLHALLACFGSGRMQCKHEENTMGWMKREGL